MRNRSSVLAAFLVSACAVLCGSGTASAKRFETSSQTFRMVWSRLTFRDAGGFGAECAVTLEGSFHSRTISKVSGALVGYVRSASVGTCTGGTLRADSETLPWHVQYNSFEGTLPSITGVTITLVGARFGLTAGGVHCEWGTTQASPMFFRLLVEFSTGRVTGLRGLEEHVIPLGGELPCALASPLRFEGLGSVTGAGGRAITIRLVS
jgi:hypothetical protein